jgi:hypothetical protein
VAARENLVERREKACGRINRYKEKPAKVKAFAGKENSDVKVY